MWQLTFTIVINVVIIVVHVPMAQHASHVLQVMVSIMMGHVNLAVGFIGDVPLVMVLSVLVVLRRIVSTLQEVKKIFIQQITLAVIVQFD